MKLSCWFLLCSLRNHPISFWIGFSLCLCGGLLRACGEVQLGSNFNHSIETSLRNDHQLITSGIYSIFRHPAYTGWFYFSIGTQVLLMNPVCIVAYAAASWYFFYKRIPYVLFTLRLVMSRIEERYLLSFYADYDDYRKKSHIFIPFIPSEKPSIVQ